MLHLYDKNTIDFTNNGEPIRHSYEEHVIREEGFYLTFKLLLDKNSEYKKIKKEMIISAETPDGRNQFRVYDIVKHQDHVEVLALQLMYDFDNKMVNPFKVTNVSGTTVINRFVSAFKASLGPFTLSSSVSETHDFATNDFDDDTPSHNALEVLNRITNRWDSELLLNGYDIRMVKRLGAKTNALLYEKKNISEFEDESSVRGMATRIYATSRFTAEGDDEETVISVTVDSPLINEYAQIYEKSFVNNDARTKQELINWVNLKYSTENTDKPTRNIKVSTNIIDGTEINYGDELVLKYLIHDVDEVIRCVGYDYNPVAQTYYSITLGDWKDTFSTTLTGGIVDTTQRQFNQIKKNVTHILMNADGYHRNAYGPEPVPNPINGDVWYYFEWDRPNEIEMRIFEDGFWVPVPFGTKGQIDEAISEAESAKQAAEQSYADSVAEAERLVQAQTEAFDTQMSDVNDEISTVKSDIDTAITNVNQEIANNFTSLSTSIDNATDLVNTANANAQTALNNAQSAINQLGGLSGQLTDVQNDIDDINGVLLQKVSTTDFNSLTGRVNVAEGQIQTQASQIALRVTESQAKSIADSAVNGIEIGGRNLILKSNINLGKTADLTEDGLISASDRDVIHKVPVVPNTVYTFSIGMSANFITRVVQFTEAGAFKIGAIPAISYPYTFTTPPDTYFMSFGLNNDTSGGTSANSWKLEKGNKATDWTPAPEDSLQLISNLSAELNVESGKITALLTRTGNNETAITAVKATADGTKTTVADHAGRLTTVETNVNGLLTTVADKEDKTVVAQLASQWSATTNLVDGHTGQIANLGSELSFRVSKDELISQFNIQAGQTLISSNKLLLDADTYIMGTTFANDVKAKSLEAVTANITSIRSQVLVADSVTSTHVKTEVALVNKIFATDAMVTTLTSKTAFINNIKAITISADKVTTGTLNAANVNLINVNASSIVTGTLDGITVRSVFNYAYDGAILNQGATTIQNGQLTSIGTFTHSHGSTYLRLSPDGLYGENLYPNSNVRSLFRLDGKGLTIRTINDIATYDHRGIDFGRGFMRYYSADARIEIGSYNGAALGSFVGGNYLRRITVGGGNDGLDPFVDIWANTTMRATLNLNSNQLTNANHISGANTILFQNTSNRLLQSSDGQLHLLSPNQINLGWTNGSSVTNVLSLTTNQVSMFRNLNMQSNNITNQSDKRLKTNIVPTNVVAIDAYRRLSMVDYSWLDPSKPSGRHLGVIAQDTPFWSVYDAETDTWMINSSKQIMYNSLGIKELISITDKNMLDILRIDTFVGQHEQEIQLLKQKIAELERKIT